MSEIVEQHRRYLPHYQEKCRYYFLTWRLDGELPAHIKRSIRDMQEVMIEIKRTESGAKNLSLIQEYSELVEKYDEQLGRYLPTGIDLSEKKNGKIVADAFRYYNNKLYKLCAYCIMPNHVHLLIQPSSEEEIQQVKISDIIKRIKSFTAKEINKLNNRTGALWRADYFDRQIRNDRDYCYTVEYILNNPVKAGLVERQSDWAFSFYRSLEDVLGESG